MPAHSWIRIPRPVWNAKRRLICLPHAGAGASSFYAWAERLAAARIELCAVQYPGREDRIAEPPLGEWKELVRALADAWPTLAWDSECALFGHSLGAILAFELALEIRRRGEADNLVHVFVSGRNPPHLLKTAPPVHHLPEERFLREFTARYRPGFPAELLADREMMALLSPILRADCRLVETYRWSPETALNLPLTALGGTTDPWTTAEALAAWSSYTTAGFSQQMFPGDHYFHQNVPTRDRVIAAVCEALTVNPAATAVFSAV